MSIDSPNLRMDGARLRRWRRAAGMKRGELGKRLGYSWRTVKAWERGERRMPLPTMRDLTLALHDARREHEEGLLAFYHELEEWDSY